MRQTITLGRIAGIPLGVHWSVLMIMVLLAGGVATTVLPAAAPHRSVAAYWTAGLALAVAFFACLLAHELAHALLARRYGIPVRRITLWLLGGVSEFGGESPHPRADLLVALAGPLASIACGAVAAGGAFLAHTFGGGPLVVAGLVWLATINLILAAFNMLPGAPLDGGRVLRAVVWRIRGDQAAGARVAARTGAALGTGLMVLGGLEVLLARQWAGIWLVLVGLFLARAAAVEQQQSQLQGLIGDTTVGDIVSTVPVSGYDTQTVEVFVRTVASRCQFRQFPVVTASGRVVGLVSLARLAQIPAPARDITPLSRVALPLTPETMLRADQPLSAAAPLAASARLIPVVGASGTLVGVVSGHDIARAAELATLGVAPRRPAAGPDASAVPPVRIGLR